MEAVLNQAECIALAKFFTEHVADVPDNEISDDLRSAAAKIQAVSTNVG
jgi:hypothetical protein